LRLRCIVDALAADYFHLDSRHFREVLAECDFGLGARPADVKGFWRVDKNKHPEHRHTVLAFVAFRDLEEKIREQGNRDTGICAFLEQNGGEGWMLPETLRLADYGLGHD